MKTIRIIPTLSLKRHHLFGRLIQKGDTVTLDNKTGQRYLDYVDSNGEAVYEECEAIGKSPSVNEAAKGGQDPEASGVQGNIDQGNEGGLDGEVKVDSEEENIDDQTDAGTDVEI